jgi:hypothetical protein
LTATQRGKAVALSALCLLSVFGLAWALMIPAREWAESDANPLAVLLESSSTLVVIGAIEGLAFSMVPLEFTHGIKVWRWSKVAWFAIFAAAAFLFWHVLLVQDNAGFKSLDSGKTVGAIVAVAVCVGLTAATWAFFYYRKQQRAKAAALPAAPPPEAVPETPGIPTPDDAVPVIDTTPQVEPPVLDVTPPDAVDGGTS